MAKYRSRSIFVEAFQMTKECRESKTNWPLWFMKAWNKDNDETSSAFPADFPDSDGRDKLKIGTLKDNLLVDWGDYIIQGAAGDLRPCAQNIFEETYEKV